MVLYHNKNNRSFILIQIAWYYLQLIIFNEKVQELVNLFIFGILRSSGGDKSGM